MKRTTATLTRCRQTAALLPLPHRPHPHTWTTASSLRTPPPSPSPPPPPSALFRQKRRISVRTRTHTSDGETHAEECGPLAVYEGMRDQGLIIEDENQLVLVRELDELWESLRITQVAVERTETDETSPPTDLFSSFNKFKEMLSRKTESSIVDATSTPEFIDKTQRGGSDTMRGVYIHGDVGCGKTMLMDIFYSCLKSERKLRIHLDAFMSQTYKSVHQFSVWRTRGILKDELALRQGGENSGIKQHLDNLENISVIELYVAQLCEQYDVICFDEFQVLDPADASILAKLFSSLFLKGVLLICTSNKPTEFFYTLGRQYSGFVHLLNNSCDSFHLTSPYDYRKHSGTPVHTTYIHPNTEANLKRSLTLFNSVSKEEVRRNETLTNQGRTLRIPYQAGGVSLYTFEDLCGCDRPMSPSDYNLLANTFHTVFVVNVPILSIQHRNEARRFITLIDELYQYKVNVVLCAETELGSLFNYKTLQDASQAAFEYKLDAGEASWREDDSEQMMWRFTGEEDVFAFKRVESRLSEMGTREYILLPHLNFVVDDLNVDVLLGAAIEGGSSNDYIDV